MLSRYSKQWQYTVSLGFKGSMTEPLVRRRGRAGRSREGLRGRQHLVFTRLLPSREPGHVLTGLAHSCASHAGPCWVGTKGIPDREAPQARPPTPEPKRAEVFLRKLLCLELPWRFLQACPSRTCCPLPTSLPPALQCPSSQRGPGLFFNCDFQ